jgi:hypothetical protein
VAHEVAPEALDGAGGDVEAGRHAVTAVAAEMRGAGGQRRMQIEGGDAPAGPAPLAGLVERDQHARTPVPLDQPRRDDPDDPRVPPLARQHIRRLMDVLSERRLRGEGDPHLGVLAIAVEQIELARYLAGARLVLGEHQLERRVRAPHPPRRVDARTEPEPQPARIDRARIAGGHLHQRPQPRLARAGHGRQAVAHDAAVLADQRHHVADRRERDEVEVLLDLCRIRSRRRGERLGELVGDARGAELGKRVAPERRVHDRALR